MKKYWMYCALVVLVSTVLSWSNMRDDSDGTGPGGHGSAWSSSTGGGSWGGGGGHK